MNDDKFFLILIITCCVTLLIFFIITTNTKKTKIDTYTILQDITSIELSCKKRKFAVSTDLNKKSDRFVITEYYEGDLE